MKHCAFTALILIVILCCSFVSAQVSPAPDTSNTSILIDSKADAKEILAAKELRKYLYLRTGQWLSIDTDYQANHHLFVVSTKGRDILGKSASDETLLSLRQLTPQAYRFETDVDSKGKVRLRIIGFDPVGTLYGVYRLLEHYDIGFYLHGDSIPDEQIPLGFVNVDETSEPLFELRGILPFHDFPEGPDWWTLQEWKMVIEQAAKMRMNLIALHCYPKGGLGPEPLVWIGLKDDINPDGTVNIANRTAWHNTKRYDPYGCYWPTVLDPMAGTLSMASFLLGKCTLLMGL